jgi:hypothetical protein
MPQHDRPLKGDTRIARHLVCLFSSISDGEPPYLADLVCEFWFLKITRSLRRRSTAEPQGLEGASTLISSMGSAPSSPMPSPPRPSSPARQPAQIRRETIPIPSKNLQEISSCQSPCKAHTFSTCPPPSMSARDLNSQRTFRFFRPQSPMMLFRRPSSGSWIMRSASTKTDRIHPETVDSDLKIMQEPASQQPP